MAAFLAHVRPLQADQHSAAGGSEPFQGCQLGVPRAQAGHSPLVPFQTTDLALDSGSGPMGDGTGHGPAHSPAWYLETSTRLSRLAVLKAAGHRARFHLRASVEPVKAPPGHQALLGQPVWGLYPPALPHQGDTTPAHLAHGLWALEPAAAEC